MRGLILLITFFTRIPIKYHFDFNEKDFIKGFYFLPLLGTFIGALMYLFSYTGFDKPIVILMSWILYIWITGGLHIDGVADTFDGIFSNRNRENMLKIMKDSRIGTFGTLGIIIILFSDFLLSYYIDYDYLILIPAIGRSSAILAAAISPYARKENGMGNAFIDNSSLKMFFISFLLISPILIFYNVFVLISIILTYISILFITYRIKNIIGGMTGDTIGMIIELSQTLFLLFIYITQKYGLI
ncbi:adenosylcobinamide-GDP ribazoletransferase [Marinitoga arctica]